MDFEIKYKEFMNYLFNTPNLDLNTFYKSSWYQWACSNNAYYAGAEIIIDGDLYNIQISRHNELNLFVVIDTFWGGSFAQVDCTKLFNAGSLRQNLKPLTRIKIKAKFTNELKIFRGLKVIEYNRPLKYGRYVCSGCGHDYGWKDEVFDDSIKIFHRDLTCQICGEKLCYVTDMYGGTIKKYELLH